jgi:outer membrane protein, heavy metal efflux system
MHQFLIRHPSRAVLGRLTTRGALIVSATLLAATATMAQTPIVPDRSADAVGAGTVPVQSVLGRVDDLVRRALQSNGELAAARLDLERGRARIRQAGLRPNPTLDLEQTTGRFTGSSDERDSSVGVALPIELAAKRQRRIDVADRELAAIEAEIADRERQLTRAVFGAYADALAARRELHITDEVRTLDEQTKGIVQVRVENRDAPRLELNLLLTEIDRLRSRRALVDGRVDAALLTLKNLVGVPPDGTLDLDGSPARPPATLPDLPGTLEAAVAMALDRRPDLELARLNELTASAELQLARAGAWPDLNVSGRFTTSRMAIDLPSPLPQAIQKDRTLAFGVSIDLPFANANQGAKAEAAVAIQQAQRRREFLEQVVRTEVASAFRRAEASRGAIAIFEQGVIDRSMDNIRVVRAAYDLGEFRITDLINEQRRLLDAQREYTDALTEHYQALADLYAATGLSTRTEP